MIRGGRAARLLEEALRSFVQSAGDIVDLGTPQRFHKELRPYEDLLSPIRYRAFGYEPQMIYGRYNCDGHQDIEALTFDDGSLDGVICLDVLEHVRDPFAAASEIVRVLRPGGQALVTVPFLGGYHGKEGGSHSHEGYPDYWRMTHTGLAYLFKDLSEVTVTPLDGPIECRLRQFYLTKVLAVGPIGFLVDKIDRPRCGKATTRHLLLGRK